MAEVINSNTYNSYSGSFIPVRDISNNILSITSSDMSLYDKSQFIEFSSSYYYYDKKYLEKIIDINFRELLNQDDNTTFKIPSDALLISQSHYNDLQNRLLNLEEDIIVSESYYQSELDLLISENSALVRTVDSINSAARSITSDLMNKYKNTAFYNDLAALKAVWNIPYSDIITKSGKLSNKNIYFLDVSMSVITSFKNYPPSVASVNYINRIETTYSLAFNGEYLENLFDTDTDRLALLSEINDLKIVTQSLMQEIERLQLLLLNSGSYIFPTSDYSDFNVKVAYLSDSSRRVFRGFKLTIRNDNQSNLYNYTIGPVPINNDSLQVDETLRIPPGRIKLVFVVDNTLPIYTEEGSSTQGEELPNSPIPIGGSNTIVGKLYNGSNIINFSTLDELNFILLPRQTVDLLGNNIPRLEITFY